MAKTDLRLDFCEHRAARWAVEHWYYRREMPVGKLVKIGVWERGEFSGVVIFGMGASNALGKRWGLAGTEVCELARVALKPDHGCQVSRVLRVAVAMLRRQSPGIRAIVSFADPRFHHGGVYRASGWIYTGQTAPDRQYVDRYGVTHHSRGVKERGWDRTLGGRIIRVPKPSECSVIRIPGKHRYVMPLDADMRVKLAAFAQKPPSRPGNLESEVVGVPVG